MEVTKLMQLANTTLKAIDSAHEGEPTKVAYFCRGGCVEATFTFKPQKIIGKEIDFVTFEEVNDGK